VVEESENSITISHYIGARLFSNVQGFATIFDTTSAPGENEQKRLHCRTRIDPKYACFRLKLGRSGIHGWGVYAGERIAARHKVIEYTGQRLNRTETSKRGLGPRTYLFTLDNYWTLDGAVGGSGAELINHSCTPNLYTWIYKGHILYMSKRDIRRGEELTVDYHFSDKIEDVPCKCGSALCRGTINIKKERSPKS